MAILKLGKFVDTIQKNDCPAHCAFKSTQHGPAIVPPPSYIAGIMVSRDPTTGWIPFHQYTQDFEDNMRRLILFSSAIPLQLTMRIIGFTEMKESSIDRNTLLDTMFQQMYWTHLHKCFTDSSSKDFKFKGRNAEICAQKWLGGELQFATEQGAKFVITLGEHVFHNVEKLLDRLDLSAEIIRLPHPSGQNNAIWNRSSKKSYAEIIARTEKEIRKLLKIIGV